MRGHDTGPVARSPGPTSDYVYRELLRLDDEECARIESAGHMATTCGPEVLGAVGEGAGDPLLTNLALPAIMGILGFRGH